MSTEPNKAKRFPFINSFAFKIMLAVFLLGVLLIGAYEVFFDNNEHTKLPAASHDNMAKPSESLSKSIAQAYLEKHHLTIKTYDGQETVTLTESLLRNHPIIEKGLTAMGAYKVDNELVFGSESLLNQIITIEKFTISGFWREKYVKRDSTQVAIVVMEHQVLNGYTLPVEGEKKYEGIWNVIVQPTDVSLVVQKDMDNKSIAKKLFEQYLDKRKNDGSFRQISEYKITKFDMVKNTNHGFSFYVMDEILPVDKENYAIAGSQKALENGWVQETLYGYVLVAASDTYVLFGVGTGP